MAKDTEEIVISDGDVATLTQVLSPAQAALARKYAEDNPTGGEGNEEIIEAIAADIMEADSVDKVLDGGATYDPADMLDEPITIRGFVLRKADLEQFPDSLPFFAVIDAVRELDGEVIIITTGGYNVMTALERIRQLNGFPLEHAAFRKAGRALRLYRATQTFEA